MPTTVPSTAVHEIDLSINYEEVTLNAGTVSLNEGLHDAIIREAYQFLRVQQSNDCIKSLAFSVTETVDMPVCLQVWITGSFELQLGPNFSIKTLPFEADACIPMPFSARNVVKAVGLTLVDLKSMLVLAAQAV